MEHGIWIKTQDKNKLLVVNTIVIDTNCIYELESGSHTLIGSYKSENRARVVFEEIEHAIFASWKYYQMPAE